MIGSQSSVGPAHVGTSFAPPWGGLDFGRRATSTDDAHVDLAAEFGDARPVHAFEVAGQFHVPPDLLEVRSRVWLLVPRPHAQEPRVPNVGIVRVGLAIAGVRPTGGGVSSSGATGVGDIHKTGAPG